MKIAILITGHMRTFARVLATQYWHVLRHFPDADFYVSTVRDADTESINALRTLLPKARIEVHVVDVQPELPIPAKPFSGDWTVGRMYGHEPYAISVHPQAILRQLWQFNEAWEHFNRARGDSQYERFIRIRPDLWFRSLELPPKENTHDAITPCFGRFGGINDRFAILNYRAAKAYFTTHAHLPELLAQGCPLHPESLVKASLLHAGCTVDDTLLCNFAKLYGNENPRQAGTFRDAEIIIDDLANLAAKRRTP